MRGYYTVVDRLVLVSILMHHRPTFRILRRRPNRSLMRAHNYGQSNCAGQEDPFARQQRRPAFPIFLPCENTVWSSLYHFSRASIFDAPSPYLHQPPLPSLLVHLPERCWAGGERQGPPCAGTRTLQHSRRCRKTGAGTVNSGYTTAVVPLVIVMASNHVRAEARCQHHEKCTESAAGSV